MFLRSEIELSDHYFNIIIEYYFFCRYKTKRAQHEKGLHDQGSSTGLPSPRRVAVPVLVRDGKPCIGGPPKAESLMPPSNMMMGGHPHHLMYSQPRIWW